METCDWKPDHVNDTPTGPRCGEPATHKIVWLDGSKRHSFGCGAHLKMDPSAPAFRLEVIHEGKR